ncbi:MULTISPECIES: hypothetical protein [Haloarcula]|uniref:hypothetical protein n=1 Tax=Haloarcula TaxID=2237 RepID=UPI0023E7FD97|nr:hypothetical protein [Halomicroarcula sp. SHR3]
MYSVDGKKPVDLELKAGQTQIDLSSALEAEMESGDWEKVVLYGQLEVPETTVEAVFPQEERESPPAKLYVAVRCHSTIYRDRTIVSKSPTDDGVYDVTIVLHKDVVRDEVELRPYLVRASDRSRDGQYAYKKNFRVSSGDIYTVVVDRPSDEQPPAIDGEEISFSQASHLPEGEKLYYLDFRNEARPKLWINSDHPRITDVLQSRGSVGAEARMRDVILDQISYGVWIQLLIRAGSAIDGDGDVDFEWQQTVLETFARNLYEVDDLSEAMQRLRTDLGEKESLPHVLELADRELQEYIDHRTQLINLMEEGLSI